MRVLWVTNKLLGKMAEMHGGAVGGFGGWMEQAYEEIVSDEGIQLAILTSGKVGKIECVSDNNVTYYLAPGGDAYSCFSAQNAKVQKNIAEIITEYSPDIIEIWGTESELGLAVVRASENIPKVVFIQGVMRSIEQHYFDTLTRKELSRNVTFYDIYKRRYPWRINKRQQRRSEVESEVISRCGNIICDSDWCEAICKAVFHDVHVFRQNLPIDAVFSAQNWNGNKNQRLFTSSQYAPFKGFSVLLQAIALLKKDYPDIILEVPGGWKPKPATLKEKLTYDTYSNTINRMIDSLDIRNNIRNLGSLSRNEMAQKMADCAVYIQASTVENHSSTLREAMSVGTPCVASDVGSTLEYTSYGVNALLFRSGEAEMLAYQISLLLQNKELCEQIAQGGKQRISEKYRSNDHVTTLEIYRILEKEGDKIL